MGCLKECKICGSLFEAKTNVRQYCDRCQKNTKKAQARINYAVHASKMRLGEYDIPYEHICKQCGKTFLFPRAQKFCCKECEKQNIIENNTCMNCGKLLYPEIQTTQRVCCSEECKIERASKLGLYKECQNCGKPFIGHNTYQKFCCRECAQDAQKNLKEQQEYYCSCVVCKKEIKVRKNKQSCINFCSEECRRIYQISKEKEREKLKEKRNNLLRAKALKEREEENLKNGLCGYCKTSYKDCCWMCSEFRVKPEGAVYSDSKIVKCPIFKDSRKPI